MANARDIEMKLPSLDDLFSSQEERDDAKLKRIYEIPLEEIDPFPDHPFKVRDDEDMMNLVESVKANGVLTPATVRKKEDGRYELLSGHRRFRACQLAGIGALRCEVIEMNRDEATIFMVESNFQRTTVGANFGVRSDKLLSNEVEDSARQIQRYIRLTELLPEILDMVDEGIVAMRPAVELSYIPKLQQGLIWESMELEGCTPSYAQAIRMRKLSEEHKLTPEAIDAILMEQKPNQKERIVLRGERFSRLFPPDLPVSKREDYVAAAMEHYARFRERQRSRDDAR